MGPRNTDTRTRIMDTAKRLFYSQGYNTTGINQIIEEAGIAKASLYQHFKSKDELLVAYLEENHRERMETLHRFIGKYKTPREKILGVFDYRISLAEASGFKGCIFQRISAELDMCFAKDKAKAAIKNHKNEVLGLIRSLVGGLEPGRVKDPDQFSERLFLICEGGQLSSTLFQDIQPLIEAKALAKELMK